MNDIILTDFPKLQCPFIRQTFKVDKNAWMVKRDSLKIRAPEVYLAGLWQISHQRGSPIHENIDFDLYYIENQSFTMDLAIILSTIFSIVKGIGAY